MSTQLILYPQNHEGQYNSTATPTFNQYVVNGINFTGLNGTNLHNTTDIDPSGDSINNSPPAVLGNWYRYATTGGSWAAVPPPLLNGANVLMFSQPTAAHSGIYQQLSGLAIGASYDVVINIATPAVGILTVKTYTGSVLQSNQPFSSNVAQITTTILANSTNNIFLLDYESTTGTVEIGDISIQESPTNPTNIYSDLNDGQVICDLYQEEDIPLTLSIDDFKNVAEQVKSYSKDFNLPATKRNNQIFNNMFEVTRTDDVRGIIFNPYRKTQCVLKQDGFILFEGYLRLIDVKDKDGEISYNVNLYSDVIALADTLKDKIFADLDFTELQHDYNYTEIRNSWLGQLTVDALPISSFANNTGVAGATTTNVLKYPFIDWNHQYIPATSTNFPILTNLESAFRPCISLKYLINQIFAASGFNYTSNFFDSADFGKLYMDFNWGVDNAPVQSTSNATNTFYCNGGQGIHFAGTSYTNLVLDNTGLAFFTFPPNYNSATNIITATALNETYNITYSYKITNTDSVTRTVECRYLKNTLNELNYSGVITLAAGDSFVYVGNLNISLDTGDTLQAQFKASSAGVVQQSTSITTSAFATEVVFILGASSITTQTILQTLRGELGQWDFLKGIMTMFNLVSMVDENDPDNILIEPYADVFINNTNSGTTSDMTLSSRSIQHDWTDKVDVSEMELKPLTNLNKTTLFKFVEDNDDYAFNVFKNTQSGHLYGSLKWNADNFTILEGEKEIIAEPFAATVSKPLMEQFTDFIVPMLYSMSEDGTCEGFDNSPRIFYDNGTKILTSCTYNVPTQNGVTGNTVEDDFLQFSHLSDIPTLTASRDFVFRSEQIPTAVGNPPADNLFSLYWQPYFNELYSADTRTMTLKVNLSPTDISNFKFYDVVFIKNRSFRVNKINYKPNDLATVEFILIP